MSTLTIILFRAHGEITCCFLAIMYRAHRGITCWFLTIILFTVQGT
jgi:hypothetical protein